MTIKIIIKIKHKSAVTTHAVSQTTNQHVHVHIYIFDLFHVALHMEAFISIYGFCRGHKHGGEKMTLDFFFFSPLAFQVL